jgi:branched-chain amino acid aminotransferase
MEETKFIWADGRFAKWKDSTTHILTHSLHYGAAVFEGIRFYDTEKGPAIFRLKEHVDRLFFSAEALKMKIPFTKKEISDAIIETVKKNGIKAGYIRPLVYYGYGKMGLGTKGAPVNVIIACWPWGSYLGEKPIKVKISSFIRMHPKSTIEGAKITGNYQNSILAGEEVKDLGYDEALLLDYQGFIAEGPGENFFMVKSGKLFTPKLGNVLPGITRDSIITIAKDLGIAVEEKQLVPKDAFGADEVFFTGTAAEVTLIGSIDDKKIGDNKLTIAKKLKEAYLNVVTGKNPKYVKWLSFV